MTRLTLPPKGAGSGRRSVRRPTTERSQPCGPDPARRPTDAFGQTPCGSEEKRRGAYQPSGGVLCGVVRGDPRATGKVLRGPEEVGVRAEGFGQEAANRSAGSEDVPLDLGDGLLRDGRQLTQSGLRHVPRLSHPSDALARCLEFPDVHEETYTAPLEEGQGKITTAAKIPRHRTTRGELHRFYPLLVAGLGLSYIPRQ